MAMTNNDKKLDRHFFIIAIAQKLFARFYLNPIVSPFTLIILHFTLFFSSSPPHRQLLSSSNLVRAQRDPALPYNIDKWDTVHWKRV